MQNSPSNKATRFTAGHRLLRRTGFDHVLRAYPLSGAQFRVFFKRNDRKNARLGMVVGKKSLPLATDRSRIKRIIRETFRQHGIKQYGLDLVVMLKRDGAKSGHKQAESLKELFDLVKDRCAEL